MRARWRQHPLKNCAEYYQAHRPVTFDDCATEALRPRVSDLQNGLGYLGKLLSYFMCAAVSGQVKDTQEFVDAIPTADSTEKFDQLDA